MSSHCETSDLLVFSHLRWDFIFQRPQHLLSRHAKYRRVFYFEEPVFGMTNIPRLHLRETAEAVQVAVPYLPASTKLEDVEPILRDLVDELIFEEDLSTYSTWYDTPLALPYTRHLQPVSLIFDKAGEVSNVDLEAELLKRADLVFTSDQNLYDTFKHTHQNIHAFPSSVDYEHFSQARFPLVEPDDLANIPDPRLGFYGAIDDRFSIELLKEMAAERPEWHFIILGQIFKHDPESLPQATNIHYLSEKDYNEIPLYLSGWDCAIMPLLQTGSGQIHYPTKTPELLAAGIPVVSTAVEDVISPYGDQKLAYIATSVKDFIDCCDLAMREQSAKEEWIDNVDTFFSKNSWEMTFVRMAQLEMGLPKIRSGMNEMPNEEYRMAETYRYMSE